MSGFIQTKMWLFLLMTSFFIGPSLGCIECDRRGEKALEKFQIYINSQVNENIDEFVTIKRYAKSAERAVVQYLEDDVLMLDSIAISDIASEYKRCVDLIEESDFTGAQLLQTVGLHFHRLLEKVRNIVAESSIRRCPNKRGENSCGLLVQTYTRCDTCLKEKIICAGGNSENQEYFDRCTCLCFEKKCTDLKTGFFCSPCRNHEKHLSDTINCGERNIEVPEDEDLILDCKFKWHARLEESHKTKFTNLMPVRLPFPQLIELESKVIEEPYVEMKGVQMIDAGMYQCATTLVTDVPVSKIMYHVKVITGPGRTTRKFKPRPTLPHMLDLTKPEPTFLKDMTADKKPLIIFLAVSFIIIILFAVICFYTCKKLFIKRKQQTALEEDPGQEAESLKRFNQTV
ncbi:izumo sperm-egg fusion protein 1-like isoform X1 [Ranitomeya variabilis]|uniref:izumo sperm-egg fusion protein 1-like isoform X1 n=1 Tax=Ranitomeya variabilis TaxID=490064 RepID=UPI004055CD5A